MEEEGKTPSGEDSATSRRLLDLISSGWRSQALFVAAELGLADLLAAGPRSAEELAERTGTHGPSLRRLLRALVTLGILRERPDERFESTSLGARLRSDAPDSLHHWCLWWGRRLVPLWRRLRLGVETGRSVRESPPGKGGFASIEESPEAVALFHRAIAETTRAVAGPIVSAWDFSTSERVVDVGGGRGELLARILREHPSAAGILFDRAHALAEGRGHLERAGVAPRCDFVAGDFFESVPSGGDVYLLKSVLHDWDDERASVILSNCRRAMTAEGILLVVEEVAPDAPLDTPSHRAVACGDLTLLLAHGAGERTEEEMTVLLASAGFRVEGVHETGTTFLVLEAVPA